MTMSDIGVARVRRAALWAIFGGVLLIPKTHALRRRPRLWNGLRLAAVSAGTVLIALSLRLHWGTVSVATGAIIVIAAFAIMPLRQRRSIDARARELGALIVVNGGALVLGGKAQRGARIFVGRDRIWAHGSNLELFSEIDLRQVTAMRAESIGEQWKLTLTGEIASAEFIYDGIFAEHFARIAESIIRSQLHPELTILR